MTEQQMIEDGWRRCAVGQRTTQQCGLVEEARAQERARLHALLTAWFAQWQNQYRVNPSAYDAGALNVLDEVLTLLQEDTTNE